MEQDAAHLVVNRRSPVHIKIVFRRDLDGDFLRIVTKVVANAELARAAFVVHLNSHHMVVSERANHCSELIEAR